MRPRAVPIALLAVLAIVLATGASDATERKLREAMGYAQRGTRSLEKGARSRAAEDFKKALDIIPQLPDAHAGLGHIAMQARRFDDALASYRAALDGYRTLASMKTELAQARHSRDQDALQAIKDNVNQIEREQRKSDLLGDGGSATLKMGEGQMERVKAQAKSESRRVEFQPAPALEPESDEPPATLYFCEANALFNLKRIDEAIAAWEHAVELDPQYGVAFNNLAVAYWTAGKLDKARSSLLRAEELGFKVNPNFRADLDKSIAALAKAEP